MTHRWGASITAVALLGGLTVAAWGQAAAPAPKAPPKVIRALVLREAVDATSPEATAWKRAPMTRVRLQPAFPGHPTIVGTPSTVELRAQAIRTTEELYLRLAWDDPTADVVIDDTGKFVDGAAVQFPLNGKVTTVSFMGDAANPVNIWSWRANGRPETLIAAGYGSLTRARVQEVRALGVRSDRAWQVVIARRLTSGSDDGVQLGSVRQIPMAFAVWNGSNQERDGFKAVTLEWWVLRF